MKACIREIEVLSPAIKRLVLVARDGGEFPAASAGAHILLEIPGPQRIWKNAYSLVSAPGERRQYEIIVRRVEHSRGGSAWLHDHAGVGQEIEICAPANVFPIAMTAKKHLLLSAGIGLTPFLAYLPALRAANAGFELHHCCRVGEADAFRALLPAADNIVLHTSRNSFDLPKLLAAQRLHTHLYVCGPENFMDVVVASAVKLGWPSSKIHQESFGGTTGGPPFQVTLARSGVALQVAADETLLEALEKAGLEPPCLCRGGACGVCELPVLSGVPEHHDHYLSAQQRAANRAIMICVSRAKTPELVLDL
jgi:ferredoxin-NADP reductase